MEKLWSAGRLFYIFGMLGIAVVQLYIGEFSIMMMPPWPIDNGIYIASAYLTNLLLLITSIAMLLKADKVFVPTLFGTTLLILFLVVYVPYELIMDPLSSHLPLWTNALKEFAFAGGAFIIASTNMHERQSSSFMIVMRKIARYGHALFCITMISFGLMHLLYIQHVSKIVPNWIPNPIFWTGFTGLALICSGLCIVAELRKRIVANLLALMIFCWLLMVHIPSTLSKPLEDHGNKITSALSALIFSGTALMIGNRKRFDESGNNSN